MAKNYEYEYAEINKEIETIQANILKIDNQLPLLQQNYIIANNSGYIKQAKEIEKTIIKLQNNRTSLMTRLIRKKQKSETLYYAICAQHEANNPNYF